MTRRAADVVGVFEQQIADNHAAWRTQVSKQRRKFKEWIGKTVDDVPPEAVRQRIAETWEWVCYLSTIKIDPAKGFDVEHVVRVRDGGVAANRESNMRPALKNAHITKTAREKKEQAQADRRKRKGSGTKAKPKKEMKGPDFEQAEPQSKATKNLDSGKLGQIRANNRGGISRRFA